MTSEERTTPPDESTDHEPVEEPVAYTRVCKRCAAQATTTADACPACGKR